MHAPSFDIVNLLVDVLAGTVELGAVQVDDERLFCCRSYCQAGRVCHPVVGVNYVEFFMPGNFDCQVSVPLDLSHQVTLVQRSAAMDERSSRQRGRNFHCLHNI